MKLTEEQKQELCELIKESLNNAKLSSYRMTDGTGGFPLVDFLSYEGGKSIVSGKEEISNIVEQMYFDMDEWDFL